jgi:hypothetical protein
VGLKWWETEPIIRGKATEVYQHAQNAWDYLKEQESFQEQLEAERRRREEEQKKAMMRSMMEYQQRQKVAEYAKERGVEITEADIARGVASRQNLYTLIDEAAREGEEKRRVEREEELRKEAEKWAKYRKDDDYRRAKEAGQEAYRWSELSPAQQEELIKNEYQLLSAVEGQRLYAPGMPLKMPVEEAVEEPKWYEKLIPAVQKGIAWAFSPFTAYGTTQMPGLSPEFARIVMEHSPYLMSPEEFMALREQPNGAEKIKEEIERHLTEYSKTSGGFTLAKQWEMQKEDWRQRLPGGEVYEAYQEEPLGKKLVAELPAYLTAALFAEYAGIPSAMGLRGILKPVAAKPGVVGIAAKVARVGLAPVAGYEYAVGKVITLPIKGASAVTNKVVTAYVNKNAYYVSGLVRRPAKTPIEGLLQKVFAYHGRYISIQADAVLKARGASEVAKATGKIAEKTAAQKQILLLEGGIRNSTKTMDNIVSAVQAGKELTPESLIALIAKNTPDDFAKGIGDIIAGKVGAEVTPTVAEAIKPVTPEVTRAEAATRNLVKVEAGTVASPFGLPDKGRSLFSAGWQYNRVEEVWYKPKAPTELPKVPMPIQAEQIGALGVPGKIVTQKALGEAITASMEEYAKLKKAVETAGRVNAADADVLVSGLDLKAEQIAGRIDNGRAALEAMQAELDPRIAKLTELILWVPKAKGELAYITIGKYKKYWGRAPKANILTADGKHVRWEYALDEIAQELGLEPVAARTGMSADDYLRALIEKAKDQKQLIEATKRELGSNEVTLQNIEKLKNNIENRTGTTTLGPLFETTSRALAETGTWTPETIAFAGDWITSSGEVEALISKGKPKAPIKPPPPPVEPPEFVGKPVGDPIPKLNELLKQAKPMRRKIEMAYTVERAKRIGEVEKFIEDTVDKVGGEEGYRMILSKLKGQLLPPEAKIAFEPVKNKLTAEELKALYIRTWKHPYLDNWEKISTADGLTDLLAGAIPQPHQLVLLEEVYGTDLIKNLLSKRVWGLRAMDSIIEIANIPRVCLATADMSAFLRQGVIEIVAHPKIAARAIGKTFEFAFKPKTFEQYFKEDLPNDPLYPLMRKAKLAITDPFRAGMMGREEPFLSRILQKIPIIKIPVSFAERSYVGFLNKMRIDCFKNLAYEALSKGYSPIKDLDYFKSAADVINTFTGRGSLGKLNAITPALNTVIFSPRLLAARFNALNPVWYAGMPPEIRKKALSDFALWVSAGMTLLALAGTFIATYKKTIAKDASIETDPRSSDFGKLRIGDTRWDIWGGFQQWARVMAQISTGQRKNTETGEIVSLTKDEYPFTTRKEVLLRFIEGKLAPTPALINELMAGGKTFTGEDITFETIAREKFIPMYIQDIMEAYADGGLGRATGAGIPAFFGVGVQTWGRREKERAKKKLMLDFYAQTNYGKNWDELTAEEKAETYRLYPSLAELEKR